MFHRILFALIFLLLSVGGYAQENRFTFTQSKMGSPFTIVFYSSDSILAASLAKQSFKMVDSFNLIFSDYIDSSELEKLCATAGANANPVHLSPALFEILVLSKNAFEKSDGAFDITIGPLVKLWRKVRKTKVFPSDEMVKSTRSMTGFNKLLIDTLNQTVILTKKGMQLDLGGIAKGWIAQKIIDFLSAHKINQALVNAGGDIAMSAAPPGYSGWTIGVNVPETTDELLSNTLLMQNKSVATSGDAYQYLENRGKRYSHIIDPRTGYGVTSQRNVTVIANDGATADWLATACSILPIRKAKRIASRSGAEVLIAQIKKGRLIFNATKGFALYWKQQEQ